MVGTRIRLDYLYLLTVADMRGTNPARWNSWKAALLDHLHARTAEALERGLDQPGNRTRSSPSARPRRASCC